MNKTTLFGWSTALGLSTLVITLSGHVPSITRAPASITIKQTVIKRTVKHKKVTTYKAIPHTLEQEKTSSTPQINEERWSEYQNSFKCEEGYTDYGEGCTKDENPSTVVKQEVVPQKKPTENHPAEINEAQFTEYQNSFKCEEGYTDYGEGCTKDEVMISDTKNELTNDQQAAIEEQAARPDKSMLCVDEQEYNDLLSEIDDLKNRLKTIAAAIPESLWSSEHPTMPQNQFTSLYGNMMPAMDLNMMYYNPWGFNPYTNMTMSGNASFYPQLQSPISQVLQTPYPSFYNPITINNYYYGQQTQPTSMSAPNIPQNYFSGEMNFGGLDQVKFAPSSNNLMNRTPAYFSF